LNLQEKEAGFSLLEVIVSLAIFSALAALLLSTVAQTSLLQKKSESQSETVGMARQALERILQDVSQAYLSKNQPSLADEVPATFFEGFSKDPVDEVQFSYLGHVSHEPDSKEADFGVVRYYGLPDPLDKNVYRLIREEKPRVQKSSSVDKALDAFVVCERVIRLELRYYRLEVGSPKEWLDHWSTRQATGRPFRLPYRVSARLVVALPKMAKDPAGQPRTVELVSETTLMMQQPVDSSLN